MKKQIINIIYKINRGESFKIRQYIGNEKKSSLVKQHSFIFQYQSLVIFKYELKYLSNSSCASYRDF
ncbi:hypothetical protein pb186bvf_006235 [Paramecium bursaria]